MSRSRSRMSWRDDGHSSPRATFGESTTTSQHRSKSAHNFDDGLHAGFIRHLAGIFDDHSKAIKHNANFLNQISSTLRTHSFTQLPRPASEPILKVDTKDIPDPVEKDTKSTDCAVVSDQDSLPPTPPDTPTVEVTDWSFMPPKPSEVKYSYGKSTIPTIVIKDPDSDIMSEDNDSKDWSIVRQTDIVTSTAQSDSTKPEHDKRGVPVSDKSPTAANSMCLVSSRAMAPPPLNIRSPLTKNHQITGAVTPVKSIAAAFSGAASNDTSPSKKTTTAGAIVPFMRTSSDTSSTSSHTLTDPFENLSVNEGVTKPNMELRGPLPKIADSQDSVPEEEIAQWYTFHAERAAKSFRYDLREVDLKMDRFNRRLKDLQNQCSTLASQNATISTAKKQEEISIAMAEAIHSLRSTLTFYRTKRLIPINLVTSKAETEMPGYWSIDHFGKRRALYHFYKRNKDISKPGDRARYHEAMELLDACSCFSLNQEFVALVEGWESSVESL